MSVSLLLLIVLYSMEPPALCWVADYELDTGVGQKKNDREEGWETVTKLKGSFCDSTKLGEYIYIASLSDCNERKGEVLKDLECLSHIVIDFWFQGDLVRSLPLTGRSRAVCRFTLSIFFVLRAVGWPLFSQHDCMSHMQYSYMTLLSPVSQEALHHLSLCHATHDIAWTTKQMEVKKDTKSKDEKSKSKNRFQYKAEGSNQTQSMIVSGSALSHLGAPRLRVRPSSIRL